MSWRCCKCSTASPVGYSPIWSHCGERLWASRVREAGGQSLLYLSQIVLQCYYRDDRVMRSLGMEVRPPFPKGFVVEQGDWSLLDPVRARPKMYREV